MRRIFRLSAQREDVLSLHKVGKRVKDNHLIDIVLLDILRDRSQVIAHIKQVHFREALTQEGGQGIGVGVADDQHLGGIGLLGLDDTQGLIAAQEEGVLILLLQIFLHIQLALLGLSGKIGGDLLPLFGHKGVNEIGAGIYLISDSVLDIQTAVKELLQRVEYKKQANIISESFSKCGGSKAAAEKILDICS